jgi:hypothetical protein
MLTSFRQGRKNIKCFSHYFSLLYFYYTTSAIYNCSFVVGPFGVVNRVALQDLAISSYGGGQSMCLGSVVCWHYNSLEKKF